MSYYYDDTYWNSSAWDADGDGIAETIAYDLDDDSWIDAWEVDTDSDGYVDEFSYDGNEDGVDDDSGQSFFDPYGRWSGGPGDGSDSAGAADSPSDLAAGSSSDSSPVDAVASYFSSAERSDRDSGPGTELSTASHSSGFAMTDATNGAINEGAMEFFRDHLSDGAHSSQELVDTNADGRADYVYTDEDGDGYQETISTDLDGDGIADVIDVDRDGDGWTDTSYTDSDGDGDVDEIQTDVDGDGYADATTYL